MEILKADSDDIDALMKLRIEMLKTVNNLATDVEFDQLFIESTRRYFESNGQITFLARENDAAVGCATLCRTTLLPTYSHPTGNRGHVMNVYVVPSFRRQGIAQQMMSLLIAEAHAAGITELSLDATECGRPLYNQLGFVASTEGMVLTLST